MDNVKKSYTLAKTKNLARVKTLLNDESKSTILFVSKYGSIKQGFLNDYIEENIKEETLVINFMYFSELYNDGKEFNIGPHFENQINLSSVTKPVVKTEEESEDGSKKKKKAKKEKVKTQKVKKEKVKKSSKEKSENNVANGILLLVDALVIVLLNLFVLPKVKLSDYIGALAGKEDYVTYGLYGIAVLFFIVALVTLFKKKESGTEEVEEEPVKNDESVKIAKKLNDKEEVVIEQDASINKITPRSSTTQNLYQTQSLDFSQLLGDSKKAEKKEYEFDLSVTDKKYFVLYGLDEYVHFVKTKTDNSEQMIKQVSDFMIKIYSTFKKYNDRKLIFVWKDRVFINQDLTLLIFDEIFTLYGDFDEIELRNHIDSTFEVNGFDVSEKVREDICADLNYLSEVDDLALAMKEVADLITINIDYSKLAYIQFLKLFDYRKIEALNTYFEKNNKVVAVSDFTLSKNEFELYLEAPKNVVEQSSESVVEEHLDYVDVMLDSSIEKITYKIKDDLDMLISFIESVPEKDLHYFVNVDILKYLLAGSKDNVLLAEKIIFTLLNLEHEQFKDRFKILFNTLAKISVDDDDTYASKIVETIIVEMLAVERKKQLACMYDFPGNYLNYNRQFAIMIIRHINKRIETFSVFRKNEMLISCLLDEAIVSETK